MPGLSDWELGVPIDARLLLVWGAIFLGSYSKGVVGLGVPMIATPIIASLYDLPTAVAVVALPMLLSDLPFVILGLRHYREATRVTPFVLLGLVGIFIGAQLLVTVDDRLLAAVLGTVIAVFVVTSWFHVLPVLSRRTARIVGPPLGLVAGVIQGSAGASGPLTAMYLFSLGIPRHVFVFTVNAIFQVLDTTQFAALWRLGLYASGLMWLAVLSCVPMAIGLVLGFKTQQYVNDEAFRRVILILLALSAAHLFVRVVSRL